MGRSFTSCSEAPVPNARNRWPEALGVVVADRVCLRHGHLMSVAAALPPEGGHRVSEHAPRNRFFAEARPRFLRLRERVVSRAISSVDQAERGRGTRRKETI